LKTTKPPEPSEYEQQKHIFLWAEMMTREYPELWMLNGSLNGVRLTIGQAVKAKASGMKKGYPDIGLDVSRGGYHGLRIELKKSNGKPTAEQKEWAGRLRDQGYLARFCYGSDMAKKVIIAYLKGLMRREP